LSTSSQAETDFSDSDTAGPEQQLKLFVAEAPFAQYLICVFANLRWWTLYTNLAARKPWRWGRLRHARHFNEVATCLLVGMVGRLGH
jgi:hypothetical protein